MSLIGFIIFIVVLCLVWWLLTAYLLPHVPQPFRTIIIVVLVIIAIIWLLSIIGIGPGIHIGK
jgi:cell division protein FtsX